MLLLVISGAEPFCLLLDPVCCTGLRLLQHAYCCLLTLGHLLDLLLVNPAPQGCDIRSIKCTWECWSMPAMKPAGPLQTSCLESHLQLRGDLTVSCRMHHMQYILLAHKYVAKLLHQQSARGNTECICGLYVVWVFTLQLST